MGADVVIAVDLCSDLLGRHLRANPGSNELAGFISDWMRKLQEDFGSPVLVHPSDEPKMPNVFEVLASSINIMQVRIARSRLAGDPPDVIVAPQLRTFGCSTFTGPRKLSRKVTARWNESRTLLLCCRASIVTRPCFSAGAGLLEEAEMEGSNVIALATHGRGCIQRLLAGSVVETLVRLAGSYAPLTVRAARDSDKNDGRIET